MNNIVKCKTDQYIEYKTPEGKIHNPHGLAVRYIDKIDEELYMIEDQCHNIVGPAVLNNNQGDSDFWIHGKEIR